MRGTAVPPSAGRRQEKAYTEVAEGTEFTEKRNPRETQDPGTDSVPGAPSDLVEGEKK
jgi:hypothetical protein